MDFGMLLETFGEKFVNSRSLATFILILPVIGLLEYYGLKERAQAWVAKIGLDMATQRHQPQRGRGFTRNKIKHQNTRRSGAGDLRHPGPAACDNIAVFFGEDIFIAFGAVLLIDA